VQRLFSTFPNGWPGAGLLLVRLCLGTALICVGVVALLSRAGDAITSGENLIAVAGGLLLLIGLWTPLAGGLAALEETAQALSPYSTAREAVWIHAFLAVLSVSVAMLGPGAWSIDARLFGRQRFDFGRTRDGKP
jgi:putative oxidoreductase